MKLGLWFCEFLLGFEIEIGNMILDMSCVVVINAYNA